MKALLLVFWFSYTTMVPGDPPRTEIVGPFNEAAICAEVRDKQIAKLVALHDRNPDLQWSVTPGVGDVCDSNYDSRRPR